MKQLAAAYSAPKQSHQYWLVSMLFIIVSVFLLTSTGFSQSTEVDVIPDETVNGNVELTPGYIAGTIDLGGQNVNYINLYARSTDYSAQITPYSEGSYSMTVNVPAGTSLAYKVTGMAWMDNYKTAMYFKDRSTVVYEGQTSQLDIIVNSGYINGEIITTGCSLAKSQVSAYLNNGDAFSRADIRLTSENTFRFPVQPNSGINVYGQTQLTSGKTVTLQSRIVDVAPGADTKVTWEVICGPGQLGAIQHDVDYHMPMDRHFTYLYEEGAWQYSRYANHQGSYLFDNIAPSTWRLYTYSYWNNNQNYIAKDLRGIPVVGGETTNAPIDLYPGFLQGNITLTGTKTIQDTYNAFITAYGKNSLYPSYMTNSRSLIEKTDGAFNLALPHGEWSVYVTNFLFYDNLPGAEYLYSQLSRYDYNKYYNQTLFINSNETITGHDADYETGSATIKYSTSDGRAFTSPYLNARSYNYSEGGRLDVYHYSYARGLTNSDKVTFVGFPGTYEVEAWATVDGSRTTFGKAIVVIEAGVEKEVDIGGPTLTVTTPASGTVFTEDLAVVSGTATDDMGVALVIVNGVEASIVSTNNPDDPNEVSFSVELTLLEGENVIETVAVDTSGNQSSDSRTVTYEVPEIIEEVPEITSVQANIDIKPGSCKNPLNVKSNGVLPVVILGSDSLDVTDIDLSSIKLADVEALRSSIEDVTGSNCEIELPDGYDDLTLKFDTQAIVAAIGSVNDGDVITLNLTGTMLDGTELTGDDIVTMLVKGKGKGKKK